MAFLFIAVLLIGVPVFIALAGSSFIYTHFIAGLPDFVILHRMAGGIDSFPLLAVPFFILAGNLMNSAGITNRIYDFAVALAAWTRGGLAHVNIIGSVIFAGMSGTAIADAAGLGTIEIKAMKDHDQEDEIADQQRYCGRGDVFSIRRYAGPGGRCRGQDRQLHLWSAGGESEIRDNSDVDQPRRYPAYRGVAQQLQVKAARQRG